MQDPGGVSTVAFACFPPSEKQQRIPAGTVSAEASAAGLLTRAMMPRCTSVFNGKRGAVKAGVGVTRMWVMEAQEPSQDSMLLLLGEARGSVGLSS
ncbi:hypothetical protein NDU88_001804 [Pleurodeles waltl]|uniref:Uncharacterized protein n=1 Tax=Pleurodeles waltl TaxID=8319 RepID=A0AAV7MM01_PLEWA|nr:hypothetical protein NDU88_001804 [Pleurodeles waltl]